MKKKIGIILILFLYNTFSYSIENKIEFKINNEIITSIDIKNEIKLLISLNPNLLELEQNKVSEIAINSLINEKIKKIEILKYKKKLEINDNYIENLLEKNYKKLNIVTKVEFGKFLNKNGSNIEEFKKKLIIETLWNEIIFLKFRNKVIINEKKIKDELFKLNNEKLSYNLSEIVFNLNKDETLQIKTKLINREILTKGFDNAALIYSISASAGLGGKLGWMDADSLNDKLKSELLSLKVGEIMKPFIIPGGFLILKINDIKKLKKEVNLEDIDLEAKKIIKLKTNQQLNQYSNIYFNKIKKNFTIEKT